jgi:ATP-dependent helicase Lhr and Lhr-like helicase
MKDEIDSMAAFHPVVTDWFRAVFVEPTRAQAAGWPAISSGESTLILAPTGSGKTLTAFLWSINRIMFASAPPRQSRCRVLYISPLKALAVDVERNLHSPLVGISRMAADRGIVHLTPMVAVRTGDTPQRERARMLRTPPDIFITTPESLYLLLTSRAREILRSVETVIIDEIHALVPTKRGAHLALSLERLEQLTQQSLQRIGLSATQRPLEEVARFLGGVALSAPGAIAADSDESPASGTSIFEIEEDRSPSSGAAPSASPTFRPVTIVNTGERKRLELRVEVPVEAMEQIGAPVEIPSGSAAGGIVRASIWPAIHPRLLSLIREHRSTLIFVNSRRLSERLAAALNELAEETVANAHHGSIAREQRLEIEDRLKEGLLPALIATSSLELGIDMGAIDLVIQIESPPSIASGMQRIGRAGHHVGAVSKGLIFPKFRADLVACAAVTEAMLGGRIESTRYPRNPLDVLAQQLVAMTAVEAWDVDQLYATVRQAANFVELTRPLFEGVLDMLSGVYPSDDFAELRPRINWDRLSGKITARQGAGRIAIINGGTIPDRGLYGVFLAGSEKGKGRVGELDEEMVFESKAGETFLLGASTWRIEEITFDRVIVSPAPGEPGKMPFWHGDSVGRDYEFGQQIGALIRRLRGLPEEKAAALLQEEHSLDPLAAGNLLRYLADQQEALEAVPDDRTIVIERFRDELGDWRVCLLSPLGGRIHAAWSTAVIAKVRAERALEVEVMWSDDGFVVRFPETDEPPDSSLLLPDPDEVERLVISQLAASSLFASRFRENATRALLLPRRHPGRRAPLWQQRKRSADLLAVAARYGSFPILLETYREVLRDVFDMPALTDLLRRIQRRDVRLVTADSDAPSPFAASILFRYSANYIYDGDAPLAERRAQALAIDQSQLRELLGEAELRTLLEAEVIDEVEAELQRTDVRFRARGVDAIHDLLLRLGDLSREEIAARTAMDDAPAAVTELLDTRRAVEVRVAGERRLIAAEDAGRYRDALGVPLPPGLAERFLQPVADPLGDLIRRYGRTHAPFTADEVARRLGLGRAIAESELHRLTAAGRFLEGEFRPGGTGREWCDQEVLRMIRRRSLARLRHEVAPVDPSSVGRLLVQWHGLGQKRRGRRALREAVELLQGYPLVASVLESEILPGRIDGYVAGDLDPLVGSGELVWTGIEPLGSRDGRIALYLPEKLPLLMPLPTDAEKSLNGEIESRIADALGRRGALFFPQIVSAIGGGFDTEVLEALWNLVWRGMVTNDSMQALRSFLRPPRRGRRPGSVGGERLPGSEGRWSLVSAWLPEALPSSTERATALARQLLTRYGLVTRELIAAESIGGGFKPIYDVLKAMEEGGKIRRGYFVTGIAAAQFAQPGAIDLLRASRSDAADAPDVVLLAATDPANPYGTLLRWPHDEGRLLSRSAGAAVILVDGALAAWIPRGWKSLQLVPPEDEAERQRTYRAIATALARLVEEGERKTLLFVEIDGIPADQHPFAEALLARRFVRTTQGLHLRTIHGRQRRV